jgi:uncharacterized iron-regulated protein
VLRSTFIFLALASMMTWAAAEEKPANAVLDLKAVMDLSQLVEKVADRRVVYVGESHDRYQHHLNQLAIIQGLHARQPKLAIGLEFFFQPYQKVLDRYVAGEIDEAQMLRETEYFDRWRFDYRLYRPILQYAREQGIPLIALNLEREITDQVAKAGMQSLMKAQQQRLPKEIARDDAAYRQRIQSIFDQHPHTRSGDFERFLDVQLLWDEGMAERAAQWLGDHPDSQLVVLAGVGHLLDRQGIPDRVARRLPLSDAVILNTGSVDELDAKMGDYVILARDRQLPAAGKLGVFLDTGESPPRISGFDETSGAAKAGVSKGDHLISIDGRPIRSYADIRIALIDKTVGETVEVEVERERVFVGTMKYNYSITLN